MIAIKCLYKKIKTRTGAALQILGCKPSIIRWLYTMIVRPIVKDIGIKQPFCDMEPETSEMLLMI